VKSKKLFPKLLWEEFFCFDFDLYLKIFLLAILLAIQIIA